MPTGSNISLSQAEAVGVVTVIVVTYNSRHVVCSALRSVLSLPEVQACIVVDNCSRDGTCELIERQFPTVTLIRNEKNVGYGRASNQALALTQTPYALLLNPDAALLPQALGHLLAAADRYDDAAIVAPALADEQGALLQTYKRTVFVRGSSRRNPFLSPEGDLCAGFLSGAVWLVRMAAMRQLQGFDPRFHLFYEDDDLCIRARTAGMSCVLAADARAVHGVGRSTPPGLILILRKNFHLTASRFQLHLKYHDPASVLRIALTSLPANIARFAAQLLCLRPKRAAAYAGRTAANIHFLKKGLPGGIRALKEERIASSSSFIL